MGRPARGPRNAPRQPLNGRGGGSRPLAIARQRCGGLYSCRRATCTVSAPEHSSNGKASPPLFWHHTFLERQRSGVSPPCLVGGSSKQAHLSHSRARAPEARWLTDVRSCSPCSPRSSTSACVGARRSGSCPPRRAIRKAIAGGGTTEARSGIRSGRQGRQRAFPILQTRLIEPVA